VKKVLALDLSSSIGWATNINAIHGGTRDVVAFGTFVVDGTRPEKLAAFEIWLEEMVDNLRPDLVVYERPFARGQAATRMGWGFAGICEAVAVNSRANVQDAEVNSVKRFWTGNGNATKDDMITAAWALGVDPRNDHEADAIAILHYTVANLKETP
jgi:Holliday junction resolvasome RuvABC endonuclease subunit